LYNVIKFFVELSNYHVETFYSFIWKLY